jgi:uracil phosphoribosyltransferase
MEMMMEKPPKTYGDNVVVLSNPVLNQYVDALRNAHTSPSAFTRISTQIGRDMLYEIIQRECSGEHYRLPVLAEGGEEDITRERIAEDFGLMKIMRAADSFCDGMRDRLDEINLSQINGRNSKRSIGTVDATRREEENLAPLTMEVRYGSWKPPKTNGNSIMIVVDPMLATASTLMDVLKRVERELSFKKLISASIFAANYGISKMSQMFPHVTFYTCSIEYGGIQGNWEGTIVGTGLNKDGYIMIGEKTYACGDFGDRSMDTV